MAAVASAFIARSLNPTLGNAEDVESKSGLPTYAIIPISESQLRFPVRSVRGASAKAEGGFLLHQRNPEDPAIEAIRGMRMALQFAMVDAPNHAIAISGPLSKVGKSFVASNLAAVLAATGKKVLLIDTDMRIPSIDNYFNLKRSPGLSDYLSGEVDSQVIIRMEVAKNLDVICAGTIPPNPGELLARSEFRELVEALCARYDYVVLDTPPLLPVGDALSVAKVASAVFLVLRAEKSSIEDLMNCVRKLENAGITPKGVIFNGLRTGRFSYGARYKAYYGGYGSKNRAAS
jgi:tyrosine-protein kinase Etk/Wzc